jgi:hypothetical protein
MNSRLHHEVISRVLLRCGTLAALLAFLALYAPVGHAQSASAPLTRPAGTVTRRASPAAKAPGNSTQEGIKVHGHWTIEVRNPDGKVVSHQEVENGLDPIEGADAITGVLSGEYTPQGFFVEVNSNTGTLCNTGPGFSAGSYCLMVDTRNFVNCPAAELSENACGALKFSPNAGTANNNAVGYTLSGSFVVPTGEGGNINTVGHGVFACAVGADFLLGAPTTMPGSVVASAANSTVFSNAAPPTGTLGASTCSGANQELFGTLITSQTVAAQAVAAGQTVAVTVVITFGSGN